MDRILFRTIQPSAKWRFKGTELPISKIRREKIHFKEEVQSAVNALKKGKSQRADKIPAEMVHARGEAMIFTLICNKIENTGIWSTPRTHGLWPKKGNLQLCQNDRTIR